MPQRLVNWQKTFLQVHGLQESYLQHAQKWFDPLATSLITFQANAGVPILVALNGAQGSGKSTLAGYLVASLNSSHNVSTVALSLDDFYYTHSQRVHLAQTVHPLLLTRGVPGTHDLKLLNATLDSLMDVSRDSTISIPRFDKARDDRRAQSDWGSVNSPVDVVIIEGWCMGARAQLEQQLVAPANALEAEQDQDRRWRCHVNDVLAEQFPPLYRRVDQWVMLQAPSFECVYRWRLEQERKLADRTLPDSDLKLMSGADIARFIQYYQRITQQCLVDLPSTVNHLFRLGEERDIVDYTYSARGDSG
ncbi:MAG: D-glycerate 3-kinase [Halioglobus sp.]|jgi:D-glycerate 3-kinase